ncbi:MAG: N-acetyltransferase [Actinobacteria bacterium HGW-Actinobacteria-8]|nr:MAG: N-acetyltransferase [Actinobacteria bacterium HGW-Actinobacteria-8]
MDIAGGVAAYVAVDSPVNQAMGLGMADPVAAAAIQELEEFYLGRGTVPLVRVCPLAHPSLVASLSVRGWTADGFENVLVRAMRASDSEAASIAADVEIREVATAEERDLWRQVAAVGFSWPLPPLDAQLALGEIVVARPGSRLFIAYLDGLAAGTGEMYLDDGVAWLSADSTLPQFRGRGVQRALQAHRLALGAAAGCELAVSEAAPGSSSQRNMERAGFQVVYTRLDMVLSDSARLPEL